MFFEFKHGAHALTPSAGKKAGKDQRCISVTPEQAGDDFDPDSMTPFRYLVDAQAEDLLPEGKDTVLALDMLGAAMVPETPPPNQNDSNPDSAIPPIFTYWSQFLDHELTARTDRDGSVSDITVDDAALKPAPRKQVEENLLNRRTPAIELDCIYGDGPPGRHGRKARRLRERNIRLAHKLRDGAKMRIGTVDVVNDPRPGSPTAGLPLGPVPPPTNDLNRDLPRIGALLALGVVEPKDFPESLRNSPTFAQRAFIGDPRNDENLVVAQFHLGLLRFHNAVVDWLSFRDTSQQGRLPTELFEDARRIVRWTFQWLSVNQFLRRLLDEQVLAEVLAAGAPFYNARMKRAGGRYGIHVEPEPYMPVEFSTACYRFGHSLIRHLYDYNRNFGRKPDGSTPGFVLPAAGLDQLFLFTGKSATPFDPTGGQVPPPPQVLPHNWIIEWDRFDGRSPHDGQDGLPARVARRIDTQLAASLGTMVNEGGDPALADRVRKLLKHLAQRNLRRGYQLSLPTGQALARALGIQQVLTPEELGKGAGDAVDAALEKGKFHDRTPLWFYTLKEAEVQGKGERLGKLGSRIVAETFVGVLLADPESYLSQMPDWDPSKPVPEAGGPLLIDGKPIASISDMFRFAGVAV